MHPLINKDLIPFRTFKATAGIRLYGYDTINQKIIDCNSELVCRPTQPGSKQKVWGFEPKENFYYFGARNMTNAEFILQVELKKALEVQKLEMIDPVKETKALIDQLQVTSSGTGLKIVR